MNSQFSFPAIASGLILGLAIAGSFYAGHYFWHEKPVLPAPTPQESLPISKTPLLGDRPNVIADIAAAVTPSVVNIDTRSSVTVANMNPFRQFGLGADPFLDRLDPYHNQMPPRKYESHGAGSGVIIREDGYILTNNHVVQKADEIKVTLSDKRVFVGKIVGKDRYTDLALVKIDAQGLKAAKLGDSKILRPGDWAIAIGSPLGLSQTVTLGIVSALGRSISNLHSVDLIQTDAAINPGNSGGPLLNISGEVIGINTAIRGDGQNIGFAIPVDVAKQIMNDLIKNGSTPHAYIGIAMQDMDEKLAKFMGLPATTQGVVVAKVEPSSPAETAGLSQGDVIQKVNGKTVASSKDVQDLVRGHKPGETLNILVLRGQSLVPVTVKIGNYEELPDLSASEPG
ncbi:MAG: trypsin-like peptidase domain-containing protein [Candidatus Obscuribacterales bacterium]|nr:trypsin-like peptidase domain-containing protein [Candidatus Obscuribacterales bacterium]